jgi:hypothetical protein
MRKLRAKRPSPGLVIAVIALVAALAGSALAGQVNLHNGKIKNVSIGQGKIKNNTLTGKKIDESTLVGVTAGNVMAAEVANGCAQVTGGTGGITVSASGSECNVTFPRSINSCAIVLGTVLAFPGGGETTYRKSSASVVQVSRRDSGGGTPTAGAFSIAAICPSS